MIARCRAKCWIIQMRELDDREFPNVQRGFKGHIIVYPQRPSAVATTLPPSIEEITTPICVLFVGANPPSLEWIQTKAKPLIVRKERVLKALEWLSLHNHLYKDVFINRSAFDGHGDVLHIPFHVEHIVPSDGIDSTTSSYAANLADTVSFESVVVSDVTGHESSRKLRAAAVAHLKKPGSNYVAIPHDPLAVNEFNNPDLLPLIYPTLFPYGIGGVDDDSRRAKFGQLLRHTSYKVNRKNFDAGKVR
ncbi:hypothetical protein B0H13DRAFT_2233386 [Mycena leptocephala]|nr:hypothetical protein B0H13DRAFT_2233386 [Mycena leptocephala]